MEQRWHLGISKGALCYAGSDTVNLLFDKQGKAVMAYDKKKNTRHTDRRYVSKWDGVCAEFAGELRAAGLLR